MHGEELALTALPDEKMPVRAGGFLQFDSKSGNELFMLVKDGKILDYVCLTSGVPTASFGIRKTSLKKAGPYLLPLL